jgi:Zn-finger nucleic acid-binding protein
MQEVTLSDAATVRVDVCRICHFVWFDAHETDTLVPRKIAPKPRKSALRPPEPGAYSDPWMPEAWWGDIFRYLIDQPLP